jgi:hypothetical protein
LQRVLKLNSKNLETQKEEFQNQKKEVFQNESQKIKQKTHVKEGNVCQPGH